MTLIYLPHSHTTEISIAEKIAQILSTPVDKIEPNIENLDSLQPMAVQNACRKPISILTGPPGTGKTYTIKRIISSFHAAGLIGGIACPTGKAAKRANELINSEEELQSRNNQKIPCKTTHRALKYSPQTGQFTVNEKNPFKVDYVILDEFSMQDMFIFDSFLSAINPQKTRTILVGDYFQLPSVGPGNIARDLIQSKVIPTVQLTKIFRQAKGSGIIHNANRLIHGEFLSNINPENDEEFKDFYYINSETPDDTYNKIMKYVIKSLPERRDYKPLSDIQVICPGKKSIVGTKNLNDNLRNELTLKTSSTASFCSFRQGDKIINRTNNYDLNIVNGDIGIVKQINKHSMTVDFGPGTGKDDTGIVDIDRENIKSIQLAYATTIHLSQGSEYTCAITPIHNVHYLLLVRNLLYTALTRPRELFICIGSQKAVHRAINNNTPAKRKTRLKELLIEKCQNISSKTQIASVI